MPIPTSTSKAKRGRKCKDHVTSYDGSTINGLYRKPNGVWRIRATGQEFTEPDERQAVARFEALVRAAKSMIELPMPTPPGVQEAHDASQTRGRFKVIQLPPPDAPKQMLDAARAAGFGKIRMKIRPGQPPEYSVAVGSNEFYAAVRKLILEEPLAMARKTGIEWLAWGPELASPKQSPRLAMLGELYRKKTGVSANELGRSKLFWAEFMAAVGVATVREIAPEHVVKYEQRVLGRGLSAKSILHRYRKVRGILHYAIKRGQAPDDCRRALDVLAMLEVKGAHALDPTPISPSDFWAIYDQAKQSKDEQFATMLLVALNCGMYPGEVSALRWEEIDLATGGLVTRRPKTKVSRVAMLWPQTVQALRRLPEQGEAIFYTRQRSFTVFSAGDRFEKHRDAAGVAQEITFGWVRDAAYTEAAAINIDQARLLCGHKVAGQADHYLRRRPDLVADACAAIARTFDVAKHVK